MRKFKSFFDRLKKGGFENLPFFVYNVNLLIGEENGR